MRPILVMAVLSALGGTAAAENILGVYEVKFELASNNCSVEYLKFVRSDLKIVMKGSLMSIDIERIPLMNGQPTKTGKITAQSKLGHTGVGGLDGTFRVAGRVQNGLLSLVFSGEYQVHDTKKPLCSQSWNISGTRKDEAEKVVPKK